MWTEDWDGYRVCMDNPVGPKTQALADYISTPGTRVRHIYFWCTNGFDGDGGLLPIFEAIARGATRVSRLSFAHFHNHMVNFNALIALITNRNTPLKLLRFVDSFEQRGGEFLRALATPSCIESFIFNRFTKEIMERRNLLVALLTARLWRLGRDSLLRTLPKEMMRELADFLY